MKKKPIIFDEKFIKNNSIVKEVTVEKDHISIVTSTFRLNHSRTDKRDKYSFGPYEIRIPFRRGNENAGNWFGRFYIGHHIDFAKLFTHMHKNKIRHIPENIRYPHPHIIAGSSVGWTWEEIYRVNYRRKVIPEQYLTDIIAKMKTQSVGICFGGYKPRIWEAVGKKDYTEVALHTLIFIQNYTQGSAFRTTNSLMTYPDSGLVRHKQFKL